MSLDTWIERSLERLEWLESERARLAMQGPSASATLAECDTEIATLYEVLEDAAGAPELFVDEQHTLTYIDDVGWTTLRDLEPLAAVPASQPDAAALDYVVDDDWGGSTSGWRWMIPAGAAILLFVALGTIIGLQPRDAVESTPVGLVEEEPQVKAWPKEAVEAAAAAALPDEKAKLRGPVPAEVESSPPPASAAAEPKQRKRSKKKRRKRHRRRSHKKKDRRIKLGKGRDPLAGL